MEMEWWNWVTLTLTGTILVANAVKAVKDIFSPVKDMRTDIAEVKTQEKAHEKEAKEHFEEIDEILQKQEETSQIMLKALFHLVNHSIDGNGIEGLKKVRNELSNSIIER